MALPDIGHRFIEANGIRMHIVEQGEGPLVVLCHGFPECWYSWRYQLPALAAAGFHAVAPDMRGFGGTDRPDAIEQYTMLHLVGDIVALVDALGAEQAVVVGHDGGAGVAWHAALMRPDRIRGVAGLSVPFRPRRSAPPTTAMPRTEDAIFYQLYFQEPGIAEAEYERDPRRTLLNLMYWGSGDAPQGVSRRTFGMIPRGNGYFTGWASPSMPSWLTEADLDVYVGELVRTGFRGGFNWYRNLDRNWELLAPFAGARIEVPALYMAGERDLVLAFQVVGFPGSEKLVANLSRFVPGLRKTVLLPGCGHWTQQERPDAVNRALVDFIKAL